MTQSSSLNYSLVESYGGTYILLTDTSTSPIITVGSEVYLEINDQNTPVPNVYTCVLDTSTSDKVAEIIAGIKLYPGDFILSSGTGTNIITSAEVFPDGVYDIIYTVELTTATKTVGWKAVITEAVVKDSLGYDIDWEYSIKNTINEKVRLLRNLQFSLDTGDIQSFQINLQKLNELEVYE